MLLYHTSFNEIKNPDIHYGRKNADFGQGFYLSDDEEFSKRWAKIRKGEDTYLNRYELNCDDLNIKYLNKNEEWFDYIFRNRQNSKDILSDFDIIIGPIANDTIYDTWGIITSGLLDTKTAMKILLIGNTYNQIVIKTDKAINNLHFISSEILSNNKIEEYRKTVKKEEKLFQREFVRILEDSDNK